MIRVLIVDDSAVTRQVLQARISRIPGCQVVGLAPDAFAARDLILSADPHVMTLDIDMPRMDGITFLKKLAEHRPIPTVIVSSQTPEGSDQAVAALAAGAVEVVHKDAPPAEFAERLSEALRTAATARLRPVATPPARPASPQTPGAGVPTVPAFRGAQRLVAIGSSTGGVAALESILTAMPADAPAIVIVQHMPKGFTASFAKRVDPLCQITVAEAAHGMPVVAGQALIAPGDQHLSIVRGREGYLVHLDDGPRIGLFRPAVHRLFTSVADIVGNRAVGVILTGMGRDGADGMLAMHRAGAGTIAQDKDTCVVFGMPAEAIALGAVDEILPLPAIPDALVRLARA
jgi:two-component system, chemotaxis family, protein-glutamate methylesterase/glutaminase